MIYFRPSNIVFLPILCGYPSIILSFQIFFSFSLYLYCNYISECWISIPLILNMLLIITCHTICSLRQQSTSKLTGTCCAWRPAKKRCRKIFTTDPKVGIPCLMCNHIYASYFSLKSHMCVIQWMSVGTHVTYETLVICTPDPTVVVSCLTYNHICASYFSFTSCVCAHRHWLHNILIFLKLWQATMMMMTITIIFIQQTVFQFYLVELIYHIYISIYILPAIVTTYSA